jgi:HD domain-containing protein
MNRSLVWFIRGLALLFLMLVGATALWGSTAPIPPDLDRLLPLVAIAFISEALIVADDENDGGHVLSFSATAHVATAILFGPVPAAVLAALAVVAVDGARMVHARWIALNASMFGASILGAGVLYQALGGATGRVDTRSAAALIALVAARPLINASIYATGTRLATGGHWLTVFGSNVRETLSASVGEASLGVVLASAYSAQRWIVLPFLVPLLASLYSSSSTLAQLKRETGAALRAFARVIDQRDPNTASHTERVADYVASFVTTIGLPERESQRLVAAARFHDLGKIAVDVSTLASDRRLTEPELRAIRSHARLSARLLAPFHFAREMATFVELHHERVDGAGYYHVPAADIPIEAHVLIVADSFDAMTSERAYRPALGQGEAVAELLDKAGSQFHPVVARVFAAMVEGADPRDAVGDGELRALRDSFSNVRRLPMLDRRWLLEPAAIGAALTVAALVAPLAAPRFGVVALASAALVADVLMVRSLIMRHRCRAALMRALDAHLPPGAALRQARLDVRALVLVWDPDRDVYVVDGGEDAEADPPEQEETAARALRVVAPSDRLSGGSWVWLSSDEDWTTRTAVLSARPLDRWQRSLASLVARRVAQEQRPIPHMAERADGPGASQSGMLLVHLEGFEQIRAAAGHLVARSVIAAAREAVAGVLRDEDSVVQLAETVLGVAMLDRRAAPHIKRRIQACLADVAVPARAERLHPRFEDAAATGEDEAAA